MSANAIIIGILAAAGVLVLAFLFSNASRTQSIADKVPPGMRPAPSDDELVGRVIERNLGWGAVLTIFFAVFFPVYWLAEDARTADAVEGRYVTQYMQGEELYAENCAQCHAANLQGGTAPSPYDAESQWPAPNLATFVDRYEDNPNVVDVEDFLESSIVHGRPGTPMQAFGAAAGGPLVDEQVEDIVLYILEYQEPLEGGDADAEDADEGDDAEGDNGNGDDAEDAEDADEPEDGDDAEDAEEGEDADESAAVDTEAMATADMSGEDLYANNCLQCHGAEMQGWDGDPARPGKNLVGVFERHSAESLRGVIESGVIVPTGTSMPPFVNGHMNAQLDDEQVDRIIEYLESAQPDDIPDELAEPEAEGDAEESDDDAAADDAADA